MVHADRGTVTIEGDFATVVSEAVHLLEKVLEISYKAVPLEERANMRNAIFHALALVTSETIRDMKQIDAESVEKNDEKSVDLTDLLREVMAKED